MITESFIYWPAPSSRCRIGDYELHCGDCFQMETPDGWQDVRIEMDTDWLIIGLLPSRADAWDGKPARRYDR